MTISTATSKRQTAEEKCKRACESKYALEQLFNDDPKHISTYTLHKNRSYTDSLESYQNGASKELTILRRNKRVPTKEIVIHFLTELPAKDIQSHRTKIFRYLKEHGIEAVASVELTKGADDKPNNCVHFHVLTDTKGSKARIRKLFNTACKRSGLVWKNDFRVSCRKLNNGFRYFRYFTKYGYQRRVILFRKGTGIQKFYQVGKWFHKNKGLIWEDVKAWLQKKHGTDIEKSSTPDCIDNPNENDNEHTDPPYNDLVVPTGENVWTMWCKYPDDTFEEACARFDKHIADKDRTSSSNPTTIPKWCRTLTGRINHRQWNGKLHFNNFHATQSEAMKMTDEPIYICPLPGDIPKQSDGEYNADKEELAPTKVEGRDMPEKSNDITNAVADHGITTQSNSTGEIVQEPTKQPEWRYKYIYGTKPPEFKPLPEHANRDNTPLKLKYALKPIQKYKAVRKNSRQHDSLWKGMIRGILEDYWYLGQLYDIDEIEQVVRKELKPKSLSEKVFATLKQIFNKYHPLKQEQPTAPEGAIPEQSQTCYNADEIGNKMENPTMKTTIIKLNPSDITMTSTNWSKHLGKPIPVELSNILPDNKFRCSTPRLKCP